MDKQPAPIFFCQSATARAWQTKCASTFHALNACVVGSLNMQLCGIQQCKCIPRGMGEQHALHVKAQSAVEANCSSHWKQVQAWPADGLQHSKGTHSHLLPS